MNEEIVVSTASTTWRSAFEVDKDFPFAGNQGAYPYIILSKSDGVYYYDGFRHQPSLSDGYYSVDSFYDRGMHFYYDAAQHVWIEESFGLNGRPISASDVLAQNIYADNDHYYTTADFAAGRVPSPVNSVFDAIYFDTPLDYVLLLLPVVMVSIVLFVGIRKGISFIRSVLNGG